MCIIYFRVCTSCCLAGVCTIPYTVCAEMSPPEGKTLICTVAFTLDRLYTFLATIEVSGETVLTVRNFYTIS